MSATTQLRIQTLTRLINKCNLQMALLSSQQQTMSQTSAELGTEYRRLYAQVNGVYGTITAEQQDAFTNKLKQLEPIYTLINNKDNEIDEEVSLLETQIQAYTKELENVKKLDETQLKDEAPKLTMG